MEATDIALIFWTVLGFIIIGIIPAIDIALDLIKRNFK